jgi:hypothetical protein
VNDEMNINENITELIECINWEVVSLNLLFEFTVKYYHMIKNEKDNIFGIFFTNALKQKFNSVGTGIFSEITNSMLSKNKYF